MSRWPVRSEEQRFFQKVQKTEGCWLWTAALSHGYGRFMRDDRTAAGAHRWSYEYHVGPIPDGLVLDHLCRTPACVNPAHLEPVTQGVNSTRRPVPTHCPQGHPFDEANTYVNEKPHPYSRRPNRLCRACGAERARAKRAARKAVAA